MKKFASIDQTFNDEYMAMHRALTLLGFDVTKLIQFIKDGPEPMWANLVLGYLDMRLDMDEIRQQKLLRPEGMDALQSLFTQLRVQSSDAMTTH
jgi:hypothetical protein